MTIDAFTNLAFDRASCRAFDDDGHMHVTQTPISKATVNPYNGSEIPDWEELGLDPDKVYHLLRDPEELEKAAASFNGKPLLFTHKPVTSVDHDFEGTVGSVFNATYEHPYLKADLAVHPEHAIEAIKSNEQKELSSAYRYRADMTPGEYEGKPYQGVMRDIKGNHVALVKEGRAGPDVVVGDELPATLRGLSMNRTAALSRTAIAGPIALAALLKPKMAKDAKIDWSPLFKGIDAKNFKSKKPKMAADMKLQLKGNLAQDAEMEDVVKLLDSLEDVIPEAGPDLEFKKLEDMPGKDDDEPALDEDDTAKREQLKAAGFSDEQIDAICSIFGAPAVDSAPSDRGSNSFVDGGGSPQAAAPTDTAVGTTFEKSAKDQRAMDAKIKEVTKGMVSKTAMDQAIAAAEKRASAAAIQTHREIFEAINFVKPIVGELPGAIAMDSADDVYRTALEMKGVADTEGLPAKAMRLILEAQPKPGRAPVALVAQDSAQKAEYDKMFPNAGRLKN